MRALQKDSAAQRVNDKFFRLKKLEADIDDTVFYLLTRWEEHKELFSGGPHGTIKTEREED
jgi:hypothetical protein